MTLQETSQIMDILTVAYPQFYRSQTEEQKYSAAMLWAEMFKNEPVAIVAAAVKAHILADEKTYPPGIGTINNMVQRLTGPPDISEMEAWAVVRQAIRGASMENWSRTMLPGGMMSPPSAVEKFTALPDTIKRVIGSPKQLADWELLDTDHLETVVQSNFMRSFRAVQKTEKEYAMLPADVKAMISGGNYRMLEDAT